LCELVASQICREAGIPAPRVAHARVWLNDRDLGFYVIKEGFDEVFLARHFHHPDGNLYDGGFLQDIDVDLEKDAGRRREDRDDLQALREACLEPDTEKRWERLEGLLDIEAFLRFMAFELLACHWDGYTMAKNNYRLYFDPADRRARFLPHGMDQTFGDPNFPLYEFPETIVAGVVMRNPVWRARYREVLQELQPFFSPERLLPEMERTRERIAESLQGLGPEAVQQHQDRFN
jgi:spore coat protein CotH